jgi:Zn-dependent protease
MPAEQNYWELGRWRRIPVAMHWTVLFVLVWLYLFLGNVVATLIASVAFFALLVIHEMGHVAVLRRNKIPVERITFYGIHGRTDYPYASHGTEIAIAWGGVAAQLAVLALALVAAYTIDFSAIPLGHAIAGPVLLVLIKLNIFLMIVALLPIGPFDGKAAWAVIPYARASLRKRKRAAARRKLFPEEALSPERRRELDESSAKAASDLLEKLSKKTGGRKEDA